MGVMRQILDLIFGSSGSELRAFSEVFRENAEQRGQRQNDLQQAALAQFGREFLRPNRSLFDRLIDGVNRLPRPGMALGTLGLFVAAMVDPIWFAARMQGIALVPEPLWWLLGVIVSFYFGARHQAKGQAFQLELSQSLTNLPQVMDNLDRINTGGQGRQKGRNQDRQQQVAAPFDVETQPLIGDENPALTAWRQDHAADR